MFLFNSKVGYGHNAGIIPAFGGMKARFVPYKRDGVGGFNSGAFIAYNGAGIRIEAARDVQCQDWAAEVVNSKY